jgi:hypothetical protein
MPSPFPGMNPYLEAQRWAGVHHWLINELAIYLNVHLAPNYYAAVDVPEAVKEGYLEVREASAHRVVTAIELLSPKNKQPGKGRTQYEEKRQKLLSSPTHLVEIDLIRKFKPMALGGTTPTSDYRILVSRSPQRPKAALYAFNLQDEIPLFPLPLQADEVEFPVDLKLLLDNLYDAGAYAQQIDYSQAVPAPKLSIADGEWCDRILQENNLLR